MALSPEPFERTLRLSHFTVENAAEAIMLIDQHGRVHRANQAACHQLGYPAEDMPNHYLFDFNPAYDLNRYRLLWEELKQYHTITLETSHVRKDGSSIQAEVGMNFIAFEGDEYICCFIRDVTERTQLDETLRLISEGTAGET